MASSAEKVTALALGRVLARHVAAGRPVEYPDLLAETADELADELERLRRDARAVRRARKQVRRAQVRIAEFGAFDMAPGVPAWHPESSQNDII
jgi:multidrug efflux pump subunit AcrA (membrane-fusion protein)